jgi:citrate lyase beta subunit
MNPNAFSVGALLYTPASDSEVARRILSGVWPCLTSICLCLEDAIRDSALAEAEAQLVATLRTLSQSTVRLPMIFVRVKSPAHLLYMHAMLGPLERILKGYVFPKFDLTNGEAWLDALAAANDDCPNGLCAMPILESRQVAAIATRHSQLNDLRALLDAQGDRILNIRVGGNDFCNLFGLRRTVCQTIYDLGVVRDILVDIINVFGDAYVVSGPVWEYFGADRSGPWATGLRRELELDLANGFFGKTAIHPTQLPVIYESLKPSAADVADSRQLLNWSDERLGVAAGSGRMNELKCHGKWARRTLLRAEIYGVREDASDALAQSL